jgi:hypothetical protein
MKFQEYVNESSLSRIWQFVEDDKKQFAVISAYRDNTKNQNKERHISLKKYVRELGYGFIEMKGGYREEEGFVNERSLFVPDIDKKFAIKIGTEYDQYSILYKDRNEFIEIGTNINSGIGRVLTNFIKSNDMNNINLTKDAIKDFFSSLLKGSHKGRKFVFNLQEKEYIGHLGRMSGRTPRWFNII